MALAITVVDSQNGGGVVVTVSGSMGGTVNVYHLAADATVWTSLGSRTGNGTVSGTLTPGKTYWFHAIEAATPEVSNVVSSVITSDNDAVQERVLAAVLSELQAVATASGFPGAGTAVFPALAAANIQRQDEFDPTTLEVNYPAMVVTPGSAETTGSDEMTHTDDVTYPVLVIIANSHDITDKDYKKHYLYWREQVSRKFRYQRLSGVTECRTVQVTYNPIFEVMQQQYAQFKSGLQLSVICRETRGV